MDRIDLAEATAVDDGATATHPSTGNRDDATAQVEGVSGQRTTEVEGRPGSHGDGITDVTEREVVPDDQRATVDEGATVIGVTEGQRRPGDCAGDRVGDRDGLGASDPSDGEDRCRRV